MSDLPPPPPPSSAPPPPPPPGAGAPNPASYASWGQRVIAYIIDYIPAAILVAIGYAILLPSMASNATCVDTDNGTSCVSSGASGGAVMFSTLFFILAFVYWLWNRVFKMGKTGSSIGMGVAGTKAVKETTGEPLGAGLNFLRQILLGIDFSICYIGVLWPLWDSKRQCLISDKATGAVVLPTK